MADKKEEQLDVQEIQVHVPEKLRSGLYANISNVQASDTEVTINFIYANPSDVPQGTLVARVVVAKEHAKGLADSIKSAMSTQSEVSGK
jgi:hypothetical protein